MVLKNLFKLAIILVVFSACNPIEGLEEPTGLSLNPTYAIPLLSGSITIQEILESDSSLMENVIITEDGLLAFQTRSSFNSIQSKDLFQSIPNFSFTITKDSNQDIPFHVYPEIRLAKITLKEGQLYFNAIGNFEEETSLTVRFPDLALNDTPLEINAIIPSGTTSQELGPIDVSNYTILTDNGNVSAHYEAKTTSDNREVTLESLIASGANWKYQYLDGIFSRKTQTLSTDTITIDLLEDDFEGNFNLANPKFKFNINSSIGLPIKVNILQLEMQNSRGESVSLSGSILEDGFYCDAPSILQVGQTIHSIARLDNSNSNIGELLSINPNKIIYQLEIIVNPNNSPDKLFITEDGKIDIIAEALLTAEGKATLTNTSKIDLSFDRPNNMTAAIFQLFTNNHIPLSSQIQGYFIDEDENIIDSLFQERITLTKAASVLQDGTTTPTSQETTVRLEGNRLDKFKTADQILLKTFLATSDNEQANIGIYESQSIEIDLGVSLTISEE